MQRIRVLLCQMPQSALLRDIIEHALKNSPDMEVVPAEENPKGLNPDWQKARADVVIQDLDGTPLPDTHLAIRASEPRPVVISLDNSGRRIVLDADSIGVESLLNLIRIAVRTKHARRGRDRQILFWSVGGRLQ